MASDRACGFGTRTPEPRPAAALRAWGRQEHPFRREGIPYLQWARALLQGRKRR